MINIISRGGDNNMSYCRDCPLGILSIQQDIQLLIKLGYSDSYINDCIDDIESNIYCDKLGGKVWWYNSLGCEGIYDIPINSKSKQKSNKKKLTTRERNIKYKNKLKRMYELNPHYPSWTVKDKDENILYYKKAGGSRNSRKLVKTYKQESNNKVRTYLKRYDLSDASCYKKVFDIRKQRKKSKRIKQ